MNLGPLPKHNERWVCPDCDAVFRIDSAPESPLEERCPRCQHRLLAVEAELHTFCLEGAVYARHLR